MGAERREVPETIRVGFLEEVTCQLTVGSQGIFSGAERSSVSLFLKLMVPGSGQDLRVCWMGIFGFLTSSLYYILMI